MASSSKKTSSTMKQLPILIFLIGIFLITAGIMMQTGLIGGGEENPQPTEVVEGSSDGSDGSDDVTDGTAEVEPPVDFSNTVIEDNVEININTENEYSYLNGTFKMIVEELTSTCDDSGVCGLDGDILKVSFTTGETNYNLEFTPANSSATLVDVPVEVTKWGNGYVTIKTTK